MDKGIIKDIKIYEVLDRSLYYRVYFYPGSCVFITYKDPHDLESRKFLVLDFFDELGLDGAGVFPCTTHERPKKIYAKLVKCVSIKMSLHDLYLKCRELGPLITDIYHVSNVESLGISSSLPLDERGDVCMKVHLISRFILDRFLNKE